MSLTTRKAALPRVSSVPPTRILLRSRLETSPKSETPPSSFSPFALESDSKLKIVPAPSVTVPSPTNEVEAESVPTLSKPKVAPEKSAVAPEATVIVPKFSMLPMNVVVPAETDSVLFSIRELLPTRAEETT